MSQHLYSYAKDNNGDELHKSRLIFSIKDIMDINDFNLKYDLDKIVSYIKLKHNLDLDNYEMTKTVKQNSVGFEMKWHQDDCIVFKKNKNVEPITPYVKLSDKYILAHKNELPVYTMIIYLSQYKDDFTGGVFCFIDKEIEPQKFQILFFDSREVHKVTRVLSGTRNNITIKFYKKVP
jgi:hypothetical protein